MLNDMNSSKSQKYQISHRKSQIWSERQELLKCGWYQDVEKMECPYNDTTNGELSTLISFEVSVQELIDLVELLLKCSTYFAQGLIEISNLYEMSIEVEWKVSFKLINLKFGSTLKASVECKRNSLYKQRSDHTYDDLICLADKRQCNGWLIWSVKQKKKKWCSTHLARPLFRDCSDDGEQNSTKTRVPRWFLIILTRVQRQDCSELSPFILANYIQRWVNLECWAASLPAGLISFRSRVGDTILSIFWKTGN